MINDNERSKIAAKLRALADGKKPMAECSVDELYIALGLPFSCHGLEYAAIGYLADLIDRPTCRLDLTDPRPGRKNMISDEERREVAARFRMCAQDVSGTLAFEIYLSNWVGIEKVTDDEGNYFSVKADRRRAEMTLEKLADLIDPTCHIVLEPSDSDFNDEPHYLCSRCGEEGIDVYERNDYTLAGIVDHANYCSYCGARVVDADD